MRKLARSAFVLSTALALALPSGMLAHEPFDDGVVDSGKEVHGIAHGQHGETGGHISVSNYNVDLVGKLELTTAQGRVADVAVWNGFAYLGAFRQDACAGPESLGPDGGIYVVDIRDPQNPMRTGFIPIHQDSYAGEGVQALHVSTPKFSGDLLVINAESCSKNDKGGFTLYDVTDPLKPKKLVEHYGDFNVNVDNPGRDANDIHSAFVWDAGDKAYVVVVDDFEQTDVDIFDITDPRKPRLVREYELDTDFPQIVDPTLGTGESFLHDMLVKEIGGRQVMLLSNWDGGYVTLDVTDPANATYISDSDYIAPDPLSGERPEGNGHQAEFTLDNEYIIAADEDFTPIPVRGTNVTEGTDLIMTAGSDTPKVASGTTLNGPTVFVGRGCNGDPAVPAGNAAATDFALVERGLCTFSEKVANIEAAGGYDAVIVFNRTGSDACSDLLLMAVEGTIPAFFIGRDAGLALLNVAGYDEAACRAGASPLLPPVGTVGDTVEIAAYFDGWGYVRLFANDPGKLVELDQYAIPEAFDEALATGFGDLSVHEVATSEKAPDIAYLSYYSGGFRVVRIVADQLEEVGAFIDAGGDGGNNLWGVQVFEAADGRELVAASDRDFGLYIFEYTGPGSPND